jgi:predicted aldo/keto reductase-like oxidoreductase
MEGCECEKKCPYKLEIRLMMKENLAFFEKTIVGKGAHAV